MPGTNTSAESCPGIQPFGRAIIFAAAAISLASPPAHAAPADVTAAGSAAATAAISQPSAITPPPASRCDRSKFRIILDVGHTADSYGALSARKVPEFEFNLKLGQRIEEKLKADGFSATHLLITEGKARPSLMKRVAVANRRGADLFLSIHHDSVPDIYVEKWDFDGKKSSFNDLFGGYSVFVSRQNPHYEASLKFAKLVGNQMAARDLQFARQYDQWFMGRYQRQLLDIDAGVYRYDELIVLKKTTMPAVLLESGSIINRDEELVMASDDHKNKVAAAVTSGAIEYCETRGAAPVLASKPAPQVARPPPKRVAQPKKPAPTQTARKR